MNFTSTQFYVRVYFFTLKKKFWNCDKEASDKLLRDKASIKSGLMSGRLSRISMFLAICIINNMLLPKLTRFFFKYDIDRDTNSYSFSLSISINIPLHYIFQRSLKKSYFHYNYLLIYKYILTYKYLVTIHIYFVLDISLHRDGK